MIKQYQNDAAYAAAGQPTGESRVAQIADSGEVKIDGVNVLTPVPRDGDVVFIDAEGNDRFVKRGTIRRALIPSDWTHIGYAFDVTGKTYRVLDKEFPTDTYQWVGCWQHAITAITDTSIRFWLKMAGDYATFVEIAVTLTSAEINATTVAEINAALEAAGNAGNIGYEKHGWWAYLDGDRIVVQCDFNADYRQNSTFDASHTLLGLTMALCVFGDMPASTSLIRRNNRVTSWGFMNAAKGAEYYSTKGKTPTADWPINSNDIVTLEAFNGSEYCADLRAAYGDYMTYIKANMVRRPHPDHGVFGLMDADEMTSRYGHETFTKKDGTADWKFPPLHYGTTVGYGTGKYAKGRWHLEDVDENFLDDEVLEKIAESQAAMGTTVITNSVYRWFARRYNVYTAWFFSGANGSLTNNGVSSRFRCQAVTLCRL